MQRNLKSFWFLLVVLEIITIALYVPFVTYKLDEIDETYPIFQDIHVMIFIGFGFLMTFLSGAGFTAIGINFAIGSFVIQWAILCRSFWHNALVDAHWSKIEFSIVDLINGDFSAAVVLITFGVLIGNTSPIQLMIIACFETVFSTLNETIILQKLQIADVGGSMSIHLFEGVFGITLSYVIRKKVNENKNPLNAESVRYSDLFSMAGTIFLFLFWPSFNGALALSESKSRAFINTVLSITGSVLGAFAASNFFMGKLKMEHIQNSTLAGGVAIGSAADLLMTPWASILIGFFTGIISVWGFVNATPYLNSKFSLRDTCGVLNLHLVPGFIGGIVAVISAAVTGDTLFNLDVSRVFPSRGELLRSASTQAGFQLAAIIVTISIAIASAVIAGIILNLFTEFPKAPFDDGEYWIVPQHSADEGSKDDGDAMTDVNASQVELVVVEKDRL